MKTQWYMKWRRDIYSLRWWQLIAAIAIIIALRLEQFYDFSSLFLHSQAVGSVLSTEVWDRISSFCSCNDNARQILSGCLIHPVILCLDWHDERHVSVGRGSIGRPNNPKPLRLVRERLGVKEKENQRFFVSFNKYETSKMSQREK